MNKSFADFFGFNDGPFKRTPDVDFYYSSKHHHEALYALNYLVESDEGFAVLIGHPGTGKSITIRRFIQDLNSNVVFAYILFPNLMPEELFKAVLEDFGVPIDNNLSKNALFSRFKDFLLSMKEDGKQVLIIVDEAQNLPVETLEELRILSNLETDKEKLLKIVLAGQPELEEKINSNELRQLKQRITLFSTLKNLSADDCSNYINFRLEKAGRYNLAVNKGLANLVWKYTKGNPRLINILMERTIMAAYMEGVHTIKKSHIESAVNSLNVFTDKAKQKTSFKIVAAALILAALSFAGYGGYQLYTKYESSQAALNANKQNTNSQVATNANNQVALVEPTEPIEPNIGEPVTPSVREPGITEPVEPGEPAPVEPDIPNLTESNRFGKDSMLRVSSNTLNVRKLPSTDSERLSILYKGHTLTVLDESNDWVYVSLPDGGKGWVFKRYVEKVYR